MPFRKIANAHRYGRAWGCVDHTNDRARQIRTVEVENADRQPRRQSSAEDRGEEGHLRKRDDRRQAEQKRPSSQPTDLSPENQPETRSNVATGQHFSAPGRPMQRPQSYRDANQQPAEPVMRGLQRSADRNRPLPASPATRRTALAR